MTVLKAKPLAPTKEEHHTNAAECCDKAAEEHRHAAKSCAVGNQKKADEHAKKAQDHRVKAQDHGTRAA